MLPANKRTLKDHIIPPTMPSYTFLHDTYTDSFNKGYVDSTSLSKFEGLVGVTGTQWFCDYLVKVKKLHYKAKKINYMFLRHRQRHLQPPASKIFIAFPIFTLKNSLYIANCQFKSAVICRHFVCHVC